ncbi:hypothetical protein [Microvirga rosea]|uniref:hypothetical protein n=1 Tax=Microvirga rosea TaxID=2715425 RepID=UPI001D09CEA3|nr:hypothetical protein [Microvirga rosea]MCB8823520.1 hypothetical protein [Microvirga rosea]
MQKYQLLPFLLLVLAGCQTAEPASSDADEGMDRIYAVQEMAGPMQAAELDPTGLAKTAVMMENYRRMQAASGDIPKIMEGHRQRALAFCKTSPELPSCKQFMAEQGQAATD